MKKYTTLLALLLSVVLALASMTGFALAVTDPDSPDFIPEMDRIAVFDMDGTLMGELYPTYLEYYMLAWRILKDPTIEPDAEMLAVGRTLRDCALDNSFPEDMAMQHAIQAARAYAGMTLNEFSDFVTQILVREVDGFEGMTYGECFFLPMVEVVEYLQDNGFTCYVCSGSDRFICRTFIEGMLDIPYENIIGMDVQLEATNQGDEDGVRYVYTSNDTLIRTDKLLIKNLKMNKVLLIAKEIGRQPVLSFGNSSGDVSMHNYVIHNNVYKSASRGDYYECADRTFSQILGKCRGERLARPVKHITNALIAVLCGILLNYYLTVYSRIPDPEPRTKGEVNVSVTRQMASMPGISLALRLTLSLLLGRCNFSCSAGSSFKNQNNLCNGHCTACCKSAGYSAVACNLALSDYVTEGVCKSPSFFRIYS